MISFAQLVCAVFPYWVLAEIWISLFFCYLKWKLIAIFMVENSAKWRGFSSNIPTPPPASRHSLKSRPINEWTCYSGIKKAKPWRSSSLYLETFPLCDTAIRSCSELSVGSRKTTDEKGKAENCKLQIQDDEIFIDLWEDMRQKKKVQKTPNHFWVKDPSPVVKFSQLYYAKRWPLSGGKDTDA